MKKIENLLIVNVESDGLSRFDNILQAGWVIYNLENSLIKGFSSTNFKCEENKAISHNRIKLEYTKGCPRDLANFFEYPIKNYKYDYVVAHNSNFVKMYFDKWKIRTRKPWICTHSDIDWDFSNTNNLVLIADYLGVNAGDLQKTGLETPFLIAKCFSQIRNIQLVLNNAADKSKVYYADVDSDSYSLAQKAGFKYDKDLNLWVKRVKKEDVNSFEFKLREATRG